MKTIRILLVIVFILASAGCASQPQEIKLEPPKSDVSTGWITVDGLKRAYEVYAPPNLPQKAPLLLAFHGAYGGSQDFRTNTAFEFESLADQKGFLLVYPDGVHLVWNDCRKSFYGQEPNVDDVRFVHELIAKLQADYGIDPARVFATGYSNGGMLAYRLALELPGEVTAIAAIAGMLPVEGVNVCREAKVPIPVLIMNGTADPILPYEGGYDNNNASDSPLLSTQATVDYFVKLNGLTRPPKTTRLPHKDPSDPTTVDRMVWSETGKPEVVLDRVNSGGHVVPGSMGSFPYEWGPATGDLDGPVEIWSFFARQPSLE